MVGEAANLRNQAGALDQLGQHRQAGLILRDVISCGERLHPPLLGAQAEQDLARLLLRRTPAPRAVRDLVRRLDGLWSEIPA